MKKQSILVVEDEENLARTLALNLKLENYEVEIANNGKDALELVASKKLIPDLVLLDVMLPGIDGYQLFKEFKRLLPRMPVIFLTAKNQTSDKISGLKLGADDYIVKPFELEELLLRVRNIITRNSSPLPREFDFESGKINFETFENHDQKGKTHTLSKREIGLLRLLTSNVNKVISRDEIIEQLWESNENPSSRTIDNYILTFRKYFEENPKEPKHFHSIRGVGYKFTI